MSNKICETLAKLISLIFLIVIALLIVQLITKPYKSFPDPGQTKKEAEQLLEKKTKPKYQPQRLDSFKEFIDSIKDTNDLFINWSILILSGSFVLVLAKDKYKIRDKNWSIVFLPPSWVFLVFSLWYAVSFKANLSYNLLKVIDDFSKLNKELWLQMIFFWISLIPLFVFVVWHFCFRFFCRSKID